MRFPYEKIKTKDLGDLLTPTFWLPVHGPSRIVPFFFLLDTGSDITSLPVSAARRLGIDLASCPQEPMEGYEGNSVLVYRSTIRLILNNKHVTIPCVFTPIEHVPILLGRAGILDKFTLTLDGKKKEIRFEEI